MGTLFTNDNLYNPYSSQSSSNRIGDTLESLIESEAWQQASDQLLNCHYTKLHTIKPTKQNELKVLFLNIRSLNKNITEIRDNILQYQNFDVLCFNETSCNPENLPGGANDLIIDGFHPPIVQTPARKNNCGGGLAIYISNDTCNPNDIEKIEELSTNNDYNEGEFLFVKIKACKAQSKTIIIGNMYRSPSTKPNPSKFIENLKLKLLKLNKHKNKLIILGGDTNIDLIQHHHDTHAQNLSELTSSSGFIPLISRPTRITDHSATLIDHLYTNSLNAVTSTGILTVDISDHLGTYANFLLNGHNHNHQPIITPRSSSAPEYRKFNDDNVEKFRELITNENWASVDSEHDAQSKYDNFICIYTDHYNTAFPLSSNTKRKKQRADPKPWILPWLEEACDRKNRCYHSYIKSPTSANHTKYKKLKKFVTKHIKKAKLQYYTNYFKQYSADSRKQWQMINTLLNKNKRKITIPKLVNEGKDITSPTEIANTFNNYFCNIASKLKVNHIPGPDNPSPSPTQFAKYLHNPSPNSIYLLDTEGSEVETVINNFKNKSTADTNITALKAANAVPRFQEVLADLINISFKEGVFPKQLKLAKVVPIHKSGKRTDVSNYRPISLLSTFSKIYEKIMHKRVDSFLTKYNILQDNQYGFRKGHSCEHALISAQNKILESLDKKQITLLLLIDFSKAFDMVDHNILLYKLKHYGIRGVALKWFESYLKNRKQYTHINNINSETQKLTYGVPQGSILGPLLFIIYINDLPNIHKSSQFVLYADDANIFITGKTMWEIETKFNELSKILIDWVNVNGLSLNIKKTKYMIFANINVADFVAKIANIPIERTTVVRFLGVLVDNNLTWKQHILALQVKMTRNAGILMKMKGILPINVLKTLYHCFVQSHLNHCPLIWGLGNKSTLTPLFTAQKRAIRTLIPGFANYYYNKDTGEHPHHTKSVFAQNNIPTIHNLILQRLLVFMHKIVNTLSPMPVINCFSIENDPISINIHKPKLPAFKIPEARLKPHKNSVLVKGPTLYNLILPLVDNSDSNNNNQTQCTLVKPFKKCIHSYLMKQQECGHPDEWTVTNFGLYIGSRHSTRIANKPIVS